MAEEIEQEQEHAKELTVEEKAAAIGAAGKEDENIPDYEIEEEGDAPLAKTREERENGKKPVDKELSNREKRQLRKKRTNEKFRQKDETIAELNARLAVLENRTVQYDRTQLEKDYATAGNEFKSAERAHQEAFTAGDGAAATKAMREMYIAQKKIDQIEEYANKQPQQRQAQPQSRQPIQKAVDWASRNKWFSPTAADQDSKIANAIAQAVADEGYDPNSDDFYEELDDRISQYMPQKVKKADVDENDDDDFEEEKPRQVARKKSPPVSGGSARGDIAGKIKVTLPTAYIQALKDKGWWDDPKMRNKMIKKYQDGVRSNG